MLRESPWRPTRRRHRPSQRRRGPPRSGYGGAGLRAVVMAARASAQWLWRRGPPRSGYGGAGLRRSGYGSVPLSLHPLARFAAAVSVVSRSRPRPRMQGAAHRRRLPGGRLAAVRQVSSDDVRAGASRTLLRHPPSRTGRPRRAVCGAAWGFRAVAIWGVRSGWHIPNGSARRALVPGSSRVGCTQGIGRCPLWSGKARFRQTRRLLRPAPDHRAAPWREVASG